MRVELSHVALLFMTQGCLMTVELGLDRVGLHAVSIANFLCPVGCKMCVGPVV